ncbi:MAG: hypothetical protein ABSD59_17785 [Terracidiphilus sp.]|jgi:hypothetical protein
MEIKGSSVEESARLVRTLADSIVALGGWVLSQGINGSGVIIMLFEFERQKCADIYCTLIGAGVELNLNEHAHLTALCQCTNGRQMECGKEIASIELEVQTFPARAARQAPTSQAA